MENQNRVQIITHPKETNLKPEVELFFKKGEVYVQDNDYAEELFITMSKELAEKYLAQLRSALFDIDLDRAEDGLIKQERRVKKDERII